MTKGKFFAGAAAAVFLFGAQNAVAGELKVNGFADIIFTIGDQSSNAKYSGGTDSTGDPANTSDRKTSVAGEVDFEYSEGPTTFRLDLDIPSSGNEAQGLVPGIEIGNTDTNPPVDHSHPASGGSDIGIEQARFDWMIPGAQVINLSFTAGAFNAPIGFEAQDAPDLYQTTNGQLWNLVPSNLAGGMISAEYGPVAGSFYVANEWRANDSEENSLGGLITVTPIPQASLSAGYLTSPTHAGAVPPAKGDGDILDLVATGTIPVMNGVELLLVGEYLKDEFNTGYAGVLNLAHNTPSFPHSLTVRYDSVDCDKESNYCGTVLDPVSGLPIETTPTSLTVALTVGLAENLSTLVEWRRNDFDRPDDPATTTIDEGDSLDLVTLEFIATF